MYLLGCVKIHCYYKYYILDLSELSLISIPADSALERLHQRPWPEYTSGEPCMKAGSAQAKPDNNKFIT